MEQLTFDSGQPARKGKGYANRVYKDRPCDDCGVTYTPRSSGQKRCEACQPARVMASSRAGYVRAREAIRAARVPKHCADCGAELPSYQGMHSKRCEPCRAAYWTAHNRQRNKERTESGKRKVYDARYRENNTEAIRVSAKRYKQAHPEVDLAAIHRRHQRVAAGLDALDRMLSTAYRRAIHADPCFYCGALVTHHVDHYFPLAKGGTDRWFNLVRTCRRCNQRKGVACGTAFLLRRPRPHHLT